MATFKFTIDRIADATCPAGKTSSFDYDTEAPGLGLRTTSNGAKSFIFQGYVHGKQFRMTIGDVKSWRLDAPARSNDNSARKEARRLQSLCDAGIDPRQEKQDRKAEAEQKQAEAKRKSATVADAWADYLHHLQTTVSAKTKRPRSARYLADHINLAAAGGETKQRGKGKTVAGPLHPLMALPISELSDKTVASWLNDEAAERPAVAAHAYRLLRAFVAWMAESDSYAGLADANVCTAQRVKEHLPASQSKDDCLQREQLATWFAAMRQLSNPVIAAYLQALLLSGARREELAGLRWENVDFQWASLTIKDKIEGERVIPLTPYTSQLLAALPRRNEWVFSSPTAAEGRLMEPTKAHTRALDAAGLPHVSLHGLRRSFGTLAEWVECPAGVVAQIQGHKPSAIAEKHYRRRPLDLLRMWHTKIEAFILEQAGIEQPDAERTNSGLRLIA
ncbi:tyrosine-type recombinase/integrase [Aquitalea denitrificans]|uniref:tyrosine-type recombinase/integrase n=1 Tax=Aquitalea denitrificans TaxID=519081 RepID=UPI0013576B9E|nr:integrase family protein [Aquitalea denitrificans]